MFRKYVCMRPCGTTMWLAQGRALRYLRDPNLQTMHMLTRYQVPVGLSNHGLYGVALKLGTIQ